MRDRETIDSELRRIAVQRRSGGVAGGGPSISDVDALLDERLGHRAQALTAVVSEAERPAAIAHRRPSTRTLVFRRFTLLAALPLSLLAGAALVVVTMAHRSEPAAEPSPVPPPPSAVADPAAAAPPVSQAPPPNIVDSAFIEALKKNGVTVPSQEYVTTHGHDVCDFLAHQADYAEAVRSVQRSSIWDANQSANFTAGAVVSYCPQYVPSTATELQPGYQNALSDLQAVQRDLQGIDGDLQRVRDGLPFIPGQQ